VTARVAAPFLVEVALAIENVASEAIAVLQTHIALGALWALSVSAGNILSFEGDDLVF
jgi:hypothetical protein